MCIYIYRHIHKFVHTYMHSYTSMYLFRLCMVSAPGQYLYDNCSIPKTARDRGFMHPADVPIADEASIEVRPSLAQRNTAGFGGEHHLTNVGT